MSQHYPISLINIYWPTFLHKGNRKTGSQNYITKRYCGIQVKINTERLKEIEDLETELFELQIFSQPLRVIIFYAAPILE